jgi:hypothetical protein
MKEAPLKLQAIAIWKDYLKRTVDSLPPLSIQVVSEFRTYFFKCQWYEVYNFIEFAVRQLRISEYSKRFNTILEREQSAYRFVGRYLAPIIRARNLFNRISNGVIGSIQTC